ncbi:MAG: hypothetical protein M0R75_06805, partial [Dehalococcoidia bacterium]|nr:hypothetical protein [Dehalococcoidia bacterium]
WNAVSDDGTPINQPVPEADRQRLQVSGAMAEVELTARPNEYVGMLAIKKSGLRGYPLMTSGFRYVKLHDDFMQDRAALTAERAKWAMKVTVNGGASAVQSVKSAIERPDVLTPRDGFRPPAAQTWVANPAGGTPEPVQAVNDGQSARQDERSLRMMATMPSGIPPHLMGDAGEANLASATATEKPLRAMLESYQGLWMEYRQEEFEHVAAWLGFTGDTSVDIDAPAILGQSLLELSQIVASIAGTFPAVKRSEEMLGFLLTELGINNVDDVIDTLRPYLEDDLEAEEQSALKQAEEALREAQARMRSDA